MKQGEERMRRMILPILGAVALLILAAQPAFAVSPHFVRASASLSGTNLGVQFKEAGLGDNQQIVATASADATATFVCVNRGGANPSASNKTTVNTEVSK